MNIENLKSLFTEKGCREIYVKKLAPNDNSKNQVYLGGSFEILTVLPMSNIIAVSAGDWKKERFKAKIDFSWIDDAGSIYPAPQTQLILYPKYPEVRLSGFLSHCEKPPSELMTQRLVNRLLFIAATGDGKILGYVASPTSRVAREFKNIRATTELGVFDVIELQEALDSKQLLFRELRRIHDKDWIPSKKMDANYELSKCNATNCGGLTLEAELGIPQNSKTEPDYLGWEIKNFGVKKFDRLNSAVITLMTPEPDGGIYVSQGKIEFINKYGYPDKSGKEDRLNFGGTHKVGLRHKTTGLKMELIGFAAEEGKIRNANGRIVLVDNKDNEAASWSFASMLAHWNKKHNQACFVPSQSNKESGRKYKYGNNVILGMGTDFQFFLKALSNGIIYLDPGTKMENTSKKPEIKARSQFRIKSRNLSSLYKTNEIVGIDKY